MGLMNANHPVKPSTGSRVEVGDNSLAFLQKKTLTYIDRLLVANRNLDKEIFEIIYWLLKRDLANDYVKTIKDLVHEQKKLEDLDINSSIEESWEFAHRSFEIIKLLSQESRHQAQMTIRRLLRQRIDELRYDGATTIERNIQAFQKMFSLADTETELCLFLFILANWNEFQMFFENHLQCNRYQGRRWLAIVLNCREAQLVKALNGKLYQIGILGAFCKTSLRVDVCGAGIAFLGQF